MGLTQNQRILERIADALEALVALNRGQSGASKGAFTSYYTDAQTDDSWVGFVSDEKQAIEEAEEALRVHRGGPPTADAFIVVDHG